MRGMGLILRLYLIYIACEPGRKRGIQQLHNITSGMNNILRYNIIYYNMYIYIHVYVYA